MPSDPGARFVSKDDEVRLVQVRKPGDPVPIEKSDKKEAAQ